MNSNNNHILLLHNILNSFLPLIISFLPHLILLMHLHTLSPKSTRMLILKLPYSLFILQVWSIWLNKIPSENWIKPICEKSWISQRFNLPKISAKIIFKLVVLLAHRVFKSAEFFGFEDFSNFLLFLEFIMLFFISFLKFVLLFICFIWCLFHHVFYSLYIPIKLFFCLFITKFLCFLFAHNFSIPITLCFYF